MKKILFTLFIFLAFIAQGQHTLIIQGTVYDSLKNPVANIPVHIDSLRFSAPGTLPTYNYQNTLITDAFGEFHDTISIPSTHPYGALEVFIVDCYSDTIYQMAHWGNSQGSTSINTLTFDYCYTQGGGTGTGANDRIAGSVILNNMYADEARVWLIEHDASAGTLTAIDSMDISMNPGTQGMYFFENLDTAGSYLVKAALLPSSAYYANYMPTYFDTTLYWYNATNLVPMYLSIFGVNIHMVQGNNPGGPGFIGGLISQGANKNTGPGDPISNVSVLLLTQNGDPVAHTVTDANGEYEFNSIAYGTYLVHVEIPGKTATDALVTISAADPSSGDINFKVNNQNITLRIDQAPGFETSLELYPTVTAGDLTLEIKLERSTDVQGSIISMDGKSVREFNWKLDNGKNIKTIDVKDLQNGIYMLMLKINGQLIQRRWVKAE